jgi:hypothetical protein
VGQLIKVIESLMECPNNLFLGSKVADRNHAAKDEGM